MFPRVESDGGPEKQDKKMLKGVLDPVSRNSDFVIIDARYGHGYGLSDTREYVSSPIYLLTNLGKVKSLRNGPL